MGSAIPHLNADPRSGLPASWSKCSNRPQRVHRPAVPVAGPPERIAQRLDELPGWGVRTIYLTAIRRPDGYAGRWPSQPPTRRQRPAGPETTEAVPARAQHGGERLGAGGAATGR